MKLYLIHKNCMCHSLQSELCIGRLLDKEELSQHGVTAAHKAFKIKIHTAQDLLVFVLAPSD